MRRCSVGEVAVIIMRLAQTRLLMRGSRFQRVASAKVALLAVVLVAGSLGIGVVPTSTAAATGSSPDPIPGEWSVIYGNSVVVQMSGSGGSYTVTAETPVQLGSNGVPASSCYLPAGTLLATFSGSPPTYFGQHGLWYTSKLFVRNMGPRVVHAKRQDPDLHVLQRLPACRVHQAR